MIFAITPPLILGFRKPSLTATFSTLVLIQVAGMETLRAQEVLPDKPRVVSRVQARNDFSTKAEIEVGEDFQYQRHFTDRDGDGWCDLWVSLFQDRFQPGDPSRDLDGDGLTDFEEMILMRNPVEAGPLPRILTEAEKAEAENQRKLRKAEADAIVMEKHAADFLEGQRAFQLGKLNRDLHRPTLAERKAKSVNYARLLREKSARERPLLEEVRKALPEKIRKSGLVPHRIRKDGSVSFMAARNVNLATTIGVDTLWPMGTSPLPDLTGEGLPPIGVWESGGGVYKDHPELVGRVILGNSLLELAAGNPNEDGTPGNSYSGHATEVAGVLAGQGIDPELKGIAFQTTLTTYDCVDDYFEMGAAAAAGMVFSNHSYGPEAGWRGNEYVWFWFGPLNLPGVDPAFGAYSADSRNIDSLLYENKHYLSIRAAGNDAWDHGPTDDLTDGIISHDGGSPPRIEEYDVFSSSGCLPVYNLPLGVSDLYHPSDGGTPPTYAQRAEVFDEYREYEPKLGVGLKTISSPSTAKNNLVVGALQSFDRDFARVPSDFLSIYSSRGPTDDGRIKPDLVASGYAQKLSSYQMLGNGTILTANYNLEGTSYAAPSVTGMLALLQELHYLNGGLNLLSSTWKALALNTTIDSTSLPPYIDDPSAPANLVGPDYFYGWGVANAEAAAELLEKHHLTESKQTHLREHILYNNQTIRFPIVHDGTSPEMKVMICWTDPAFQFTNGPTSLDEGVTDITVAATPADAAPKLINDLDLRVIPPVGPELEPWVLDPATPLVAATKGDNVLDNVEQVIIPTPVAGIYEVVIRHEGSLRAATLVEPGDPLYDASKSPQYRLENTNREQNVSVVISGNAELPDDKMYLEASTVSGNNVLLNIYGTKGVHYQIEGSDDLGLTEEWNEVGGPIPISSVPQPVTITPSVDEPKKFYRLREVSPNN